MTGPVLKTQPPYRSVNSAVKMDPALFCNPADTKLSCDPVETTHNRTEHKNSEHEIKVMLPDLFVSFLSRKPQLNPYYESIREESEAWVSKSVTPSDCLRVPFNAHIIFAENAN